MSAAKRSREISVAFGTFAPLLHDQLFKQGVRIDPRIDPKLYSEVTHHQHDMNALIRLRVRGVLTDSESTKAGKRLLKLIIETLEGVA